MREKLIGNPTEADDDNNNNILTFYLFSLLGVVFNKEEKVKETKTRIVGFPRMRLYYEYYY